MMNDKYDADPKVRSRLKFYNKSRHFAEDIVPSPRPSSISTVARRQDERNTIEHKDEDHYGVISKSEIEAIIKVYDKQQQDLSKKNNPISCNEVRGGSYAKLLFSKPGFHHPGATEYLVKQIGIKDIGRDSLLGGHSTYDAGSMSLEAMNKAQQKLYIKQESMRLYDHISYDEELKVSMDTVDRLVSLDNSDGNALAVSGKMLLRKRKFESAVRDLESALTKGCWDPNKIKLDLAEAHYNISMSFYVKEDFNQAQRNLMLAWQYNCNDEKINLQLQVCGLKLQQKNRQFGVQEHWARRK